MAASNPDALEIGEQVERYRVEAVLTQTPGASTYRVRHEALGTTHALKVLLSVPRGARERLMREARLQATLRHPNIVAVTDVLEIAGMPALLSEFVPGTPLSAVLTRGQLPLRRAERIFREILAGVAYLHENGVIHRDLRPRKVLVAEDGGQPTRITGFGLARQLAPTGPGGRLTVTGEVLGEVGYMPPEQWRDPRAVDERADVFALGAILYEMLCGRPAFSGDILAVAAAVRMHRFTPIAHGRADVPVRMRVLVDRCLEPGPDDRPRDVGSMVRELDGDGWTVRTPSGHPSDGIPRAAADSAAASPVVPDGVVCVAVDEAGNGCLLGIAVQLTPGAGEVVPLGAAGPRAAAAAHRAVVATLGAAAGRYDVRWHVRGATAAVDGASLALAVAVAVEAARRGGAAPAGLAYTGEVHVDGVLQAVTHMPAKRRAAAQAGLRLVAPSEPAATLAELLAWIFPAPPGGNS